MDQCGDSIQNVEDIKVELNDFYKIHLGRTGIGFDNSCAKYVEALTVSGFFLLYFDERIIWFAMFN